jgi:NitT/TauT family transport system substrate-binding protein
MDFVPVLRDMEYMNSGLEPSDVFELKFIEEVHTENAHY